MNTPLYELPEFTPITDVLNCNNCSLRSECEKLREHEKVSSKYDCEKFVRLVSGIKLFFEFSILAIIIAISIFYFHTFWKPTFYSIATFIVILFFDLFSDKIIYKICLNSENKRRNEYNEKVEKLKKENEAIERANLGITEEVQKFLDNANNMLNELISIYNSIKEHTGLETKEGERVLKKFEGVNSELEILNGKLSKGNFDASYISTLYKVHLPKLLEYANKFAELLNSKTITQNQIIKFADLLEVFRIKIANHTQYLKDKVEDDFIIKITALNEDVMPEFDGSEVEKHD